MTDPFLSNLDRLEPPLRSRAPEHWGASLDVLFPSRDGALSPTTIVPWPRASGRRGARYDAERVRAAILDPPPPGSVDPRGLSASQPGITRAGVEYYLTAETYRLTGLTYADQDSIGNQRPLVYRREGAFAVVSIILSGHHRAAAALLSGQGLIATVVDERERGRSEPPRGGARMVTQSLFVGDHTDFPHTATATAEDAAAIARAGGRALTADRAVAVGALVLLGVGEDAARRRVGFATGAAGDEEPDDDPLPPPPP